MFAQAPFLYSQMLTFLLRAISNKFVPLPTSDLHLIVTHLLLIIRLSVFGFAQKIHTPHALKCCGAGRREINPTSCAEFASETEPRSDQFSGEIESKFYNVRTL